ncbi:MAG TPA: adenylate/guanylate cyclase domain-containing protein, partial [Chthoniobacterales bacterium]
PFAIAVALHHGVVTCGNIGLVAQRDATIIGDTVNTAFRLEGVMKELGVSCLCSESFAKTFPHSHGFRDLGPRLLKGKSKPVRVFEVMS